MKPWPRMMDIACGGYERLSFYFVFDTVDVRFGGFFDAFDGSFRVVYPCGGCICIAGVLSF